MAQIIQTICDPCQVDSIQTPGFPFRINDVEVDLCDEHIKAMTLFDLVQSLEQGDIAARPAVSQAAAPRNRGEHTGPVCPHGCNAGKNFKSMQGFRNHWTRNHRDEPLP